MDRNIHDIYDVILKIIIAVYGSVFLNFMGIEKEIKEILSVEITTLSGNKLYLDYLCLLDDNTLCHIEFQYPNAKPEDYGRFFRYNVAAEVRYQKRAETYVFNFTSKKKSKCIKIGKTKAFNPIYFNLDDIDFKYYFKKINIKVKSNISLTNEEELALLLMPIASEFQGDVKVLKWISEIIVKKELFDETKYEFVHAIVDLEIDNFLTNDEKKEIAEEIRMTPQAQSLVLQAIREVNQKVLYEKKQEGIEEGFEEGIEQGIERVARNLKGDMDVEKISAVTGLSVDRINSL